VGLTAAARAQDSAAIPLTGTAAVTDTVALKFTDAPLAAVIQAMARHLPKPVLTASVPDVRVTFETPGYVPDSTVAPLLSGLVSLHGLELTEDATYYRVAPKPPPAAATAAEQQGAAGGIKFHTIQLKHARAADVAATINQLFGGGGGLGASGFATGTLSDELRRAGQPAPAGGGGEGSLTGGHVIVPDALTNSLLLRATDHDFALVAEAVERLDVRPLQVLIEVLIIEARRDRSFSLGADLDLATQDIGGGATVDGSLRGAGLGDVVIRFMDLAKGRIDALISVAESRGDVKIISRPVLLASNNTEARFLVGSQRPFVQVSRSLPTDTPSRDQVVQYRDVGTKLTVRPTINADGYVSLVVQQEVNAATSETQFDAPIISTREAFTQVLVRDGQTIVIGGLQDQQQDYTRHGIPILSSIPLIGGLFGGQSRRSTGTELFLFLTPRIIRSDAEADAVTQPRLPEAMRVTADSAAASDSAGVLPDNSNKSGPPAAEPEP
jgi:general secretion pathway protein D